MVFSFRKAFVEIPGRADEGEMREGLREIPQVFTAGSELFGVKAKVIGIAQGFLKNESGLLKIAGTGKTFSVPK